MVVPVTNAESSDARNSATPAMSAGVPKRPTGTHCGMRSCCASGTQREYGTWIVSVRSGAIAFTRTPSLPSSTARLFVNWVIAPLNAL